MAITGGGGGCSRHGAVWLAVLSSVAEEVLHVGSRSQAGVHDTTRQAMRPEQPISWWHWP